MVEFKLNTENINVIIKSAPISLTGIARIKEYRRRKYHSGIILRGVVNELANIRLETLPKISGSINRTEEHISRAEKKSLKKNIAKGINKEDILLMVGDELER